MDYWSGVLGNILATLIGTGIAAVLGLELYKRQLKQDKSNKIDSAVQSLIWELDTHKDLMGKHLRYVQEGQNIEHHPSSYMFSTVSYEAVKSAGWISLFSPDIQYTVFQHYLKCYEINKILNRIADEWPDIPAKRRDMYLRRSDEFYRDAKKNIDGVIKVIKNERR